MVTNCFLVTKILKLIKKWHQTALKSAKMAPESLRADRNHLAVCSGRGAEGGGEGSQSPQSSASPTSDFATDHRLGAQNEKKFPVRDLNPGRAGVFAEE